MIKLTRKPNGDVLGLPVCLSSEIIAKFTNKDTSYVEITKTVMLDGVFLKFEAIKTEKTIE